MSQISMKYEKVVLKKISLDYLLHLPDDYDPTKSYPLILFLHGAGERGDNLDLIKVHGLPKIVEQDTNFPFIVVSPQCPENDYWNVYDNDIIELLKDIENSYSVDSKSIYLTGLSIGGCASWHLGIKYPDKFAAIVPICGAFENPSKVIALVNTPIWTFHGAKDDIIPIQQTEILVNTLKEHQGNIKFTVYPDAHHNSWTDTYNNPELYDWMLSQRKK